MMLAPKAVDAKDYCLLFLHIIMYIHGDQNEVPIALVLCTVDPTGQVVPDIWEEP